MPDAPRPAPDSSPPPVPSPRTTPARKTRGWLVVCAEHGADCMSVGFFDSQEEAEAYQRYPLNLAGWHNRGRVEQAVSARASDFVAPSAPPVPAPGLQVQENQRLMGSTMKNQPQGLVPSREAEVRAFAAWLAGEYPEIQREHIADAAEEYLNTTGQGGAAPAPAPPLALGDLEAQSARDIAELQAAAQEYEDSAEACDSPALAEFRVRRRTRAMRLLAIAERVAQLVAAARRGAALEASLAKGVAWTGTTAAGPAPLPEGWPQHLDPRFDEDFRRPIPSPPTASLPTDG